MISVVVPIRFRPDLTRVCIDSVLAYTKSPKELILVQDGEDPEICELLKQYDCKKVYHETAKGYPGAINAGYKQVAPESSHVVFLNSDTVTIPGWDTEILKAFGKIEKTGLVGPRLSDQEGEQSVEGSLSGCVEVDMVKGAVVCLSREVCKKIETDGKILDERFGLGGGDDNDLCLRVQNAGYKVVVCYESFVYHYSSAAFRILFNHDVEYSRRYSSRRLFDYLRKWDIKEKPRVMVAIPCVDGFVYHELLIRCLQWSTDDAIDISVRFYPYMQPLDSARNHAVCDFLEGFWHFLFFVDADVVPPINCLQKLIGADVPVIGPACMTFRPDDDGNPFPHPSAFRLDEDGYRIQYGTGVEEVDIVGGGAFLVRREVFEKIDRPFAFTYDKRGRTEHSEDFVFSQKARRHGFKTYVDFSCFCKHVKDVDALGINRLLVKLNGR